jgi:hypothetical protein
VLVRRFLRSIHIVAPTSALLFCAVILLGCQPAEPVPPSPIAPLLEGESSPVGATPGSSSATATPTVRPSPTASTTATRSAAPISTPTQIANSTLTKSALPTPAVIRAKIEIVWPHDGANVRDATQANITAYLLAPGAAESPPCDWEPVVRLWAARNAEPARPIAIGEKRFVETEGRRFPVWDFNDVDVSAAQDPQNKLTFFVMVDGTRTYHNIWVHAQDARTVLAQPDQPASVLERAPEAVDGRIEIVWPHGGAPIAEADLANITTYLFEADSLNAISPGTGWDPTVSLHRALNTETEAPDAEPPIGQERAQATTNGEEMLVWDFNDVDISAARDRLNKIYFWVSVEGEETFPNVWAHGADAPTVFPQVDVPESCR